jgi:hypothetical protein
MKYNFEIPMTRSVGASAIVVAVVAALSTGLLLTRQVVGAQYDELAAKNAQIDILQRRLALPVAKTPVESNDNIFVDGANYALGANNFQQHIVELIEQSGGKIASVSVETPTATEQTTRRIVVQVRSELDNDALQNVLYGLESGRPLAIVDSLNVHRAASVDNVKLDGKQSPKLTVELRVGGYYRKAAK